MTAGWNGEIEALRGQVRNLEQARTLDRRALQKRAKVIDTAWAVIGRVRWVPLIQDASQAGTNEHGHVVAPFICPFKTVTGCDAGTEPLPAGTALEDITVAIRPHDGACPCTLADAWVVMPEQPPTYTTASVEPCTAARAATVGGAQ